MAEFDGFSGVARGGADQARSLAEVTEQRRALPPELPGKPLLGVDARADQL